jgi:micrococcal nuclease
MHLALSGANASRQHRRGERRSAAPFRPFRPSRGRAWGRCVLRRSYWLLGLAGAIAWPMAEACAQARSGRPVACASEAAENGNVATVVDGRSFVVEDGRAIRLPGIEVPLPPLPGETGARGEAARAARAALQDLVGGQSVELRHNGGDADRYGRELAHAYLGRGRSLRSAAHEMVTRGFARVAAQVGDRGCAEELWARERTARQAKLGLWGGEPYFVVMGADSLVGLVAGRGQFSLVEGKVLSVRESGNTIYVNFGRRWSEALTVTISKRNERTFAAGGVDPKRLENLRVRVRGFIEERSGPRIEATSPDQIELAERN